MIHRLWTQLRMLFQQEQLDKDLDAELAHHLELKARDSGDPRTARRALGNSLYWKEEARRQWIGPWVEGVLGDVRLAVRRLSHDRGFSLIAIVTLALGMGATTAIFSLLNSLLWRPLPVREPEQIVRFVVTRLSRGERHWVDGQPVPARERAAFSWAMWQALQKHGRIFSGFLGFTSSGSVNVEHKGIPRQVRFVLASGSTFDIFGLRPRAGRLFSATDDVAGRGPGAAWPAVISDALWDRMFQRSPSAIGEPLTVDRQPFVVIGVLPPEFKGPNPGAEFDLWMPIQSGDALFPLFRWKEDPSLQVLRPFARLNPGVTVEQANQFLSGISASVMEESIDPRETGQRRSDLLAMKLEARPGGNGFSWLTVTYLRPLTVLFAAVAAVLLIAATNLTSLFLARATARRQELAIRVSLGAPASRLRREILIESGLLACAGSLSGLLLGQWLAVGLQEVLSPVGSPIRLDTSLDLRTFGFCLAVLVLVTLVAGLGPSLQASRVPPQAALKQAVGSPAQLGIRGALVALQVGLSLVLCVGAGMMISSLRALVQDSTGLAANASVFLWPDLLNAGISRERMPRAYESILARLRAQPNIRGAAWTNTIPLSGALSMFSIEVPGHAELPVAQRQVLFMRVSDGYFAATGVRLIAGSDLPDPASERPNTAVISESLARRFFGSPEAALGQRFRPHGLEWHDVVGVSADSKYHNLREARPATVYLPYWGATIRPGYSLALGFHGGQAAAVAAAARVLREEAGRVPFIDLRTIENNIANQTGTERLLSFLLGALACLAVLISATGLAGLLSYLVEQRRRDLGVRLALGASATSVGALIIRHAMKMTAAGLALGAVLSYVLRRSLDSFLFGITPADPRIWLAAGAILMLAAITASLVPAWRAGTIDPIRMLRNE